jgi:signal recognition particle subunit SRP54
MVLTDLSTKLSDAFRSLGRSSEVEDAVVDKCINSIVRALMESDVSFKVVADLKNKLKTVLSTAEQSAQPKKKLIEKTVFNYLVDLLSPKNRMSDTASLTKPLKKGKQFVSLFLGLQGAGKTTSVAKYANYMQKRGYKVALVCADTFRAGAFDQLKQNAIKIRVPFYGSYTETDPVLIANEGVNIFKREKYDLIIVDSSGRHKQEQGLFDEMRQIQSAINPDECVLVMDSHIGQSAYDHAKAFSDLSPVASVMLTKMDGHAKGGGALSAVAATGAPITFIGTGEHFDEFEKFDPKGFVGRLLGLGDISGLVESITGAVDMDTQKNMVERLSQGKFTLRDFYSQLQSITKMGPMSKVMSMIPGMSQIGGAMRDTVANEGQQNMKKFIVMLDSCSDKELDAPKLQFEQSRIDRIARGSGSDPILVQAMLDQFKQYQKMIDKMGKAGLGKEMSGLAGMPSLSGGKGGNPAQMMQKLQKAIDPRMLASMGGAQGLMSMMQDFSNNEDMAAMMKQLGGGASGNKKRR